MPRQKQIVSEIKRNVSEEESDGSEIGNTSEADSDASSLDDSFDHLTTDELIALAQEVEKSSDLEQTVTLCDAILTRKCLDYKDETSAELGEYWLNYGNALLSREEMTGELFSSSKEKDNESLEIAWNSLDLARICLEKSLSSILSKEKDIVDIIEFCTNSLSDETYLRPQIQSDAKSERDASLLRFAHLRMGDFKQSSHDYEGAVEEFSLSLQLSLRYCKDISKGLSAAVPLTQCFMALDHEGTEIMFKLCMRLIEYELNEDDTPTDRKSLLLETQSDLQLQLEDFLQNRNEVLDELKKLLRPNENVESERLDSDKVETSRKRPEPENPVLDLGKLGKKKNSGKSLQKPLD